MFLVLLNLAVIFGLLLINQYLWKTKKLTGESARKSLHIIIGTYGAFWPFYMSWTQIEIIAFVALGFILLMRSFSIFQSVYDVRRYSWGDLIGPLAVLLLTLFQPNKWLFALVVLHIALADGLAALIGTKYGKGNRYMVFGHIKSWAGTIAFAVTSFVLIITMLLFSPLSFQMPILLLLIGVPILTAAIENISPYGSDNLFVPLALITIIR